MKHSIFKDISNTTPFASSELVQIYDAIKSELYKADINELRAETDEDKQGKLKAKLRLFTPSGLFTKREAKGLIEYSNIVHLDFDKIPLTEMDAIREALINEPTTHLLFTSPRGFGFKVLTKHNGTIHKEAWLQYADYVEALINRETDTSVKDIPRACYISSDAKAYFNPNSLIFDVKPIEVITLTKPIAVKKMYNSGSISDRYKLKAVDKYILSACDTIINNFNSNAPRHPQIARTITLFGYCKQYDNTVVREVYEALQYALGTKLYSSHKEATEKRAYNSLKEAYKIAVPTQTEYLNNL